MRNRLSLILGSKETDRLVMGTFHRWVERFLALSDSRIRRAESAASSLNHSVCVRCKSTVCVPQIERAKFTHQVSRRTDLRKYGKLVNLASSFTIADRDDWLVPLSPFHDQSPLIPHNCSSLATIKRVVSSLEIPDVLKKELKPPTYLDHISKCKARMIMPEELRMSKQGGWDQNKFEWIARVYE